jgi:hypothetical protein
MKKEITNNKFEDIAELKEKIAEVKQDKSIEGREEPRK